jgi:hypothetical protein
MDKLTKKCKRCKLNFWMGIAIGMILVFAMFLIRGIKYG